MVGAMTEPGSGSAAGERGDEARTWFSKGEWTYNGQPINVADMDAVVAAALAEARAEGDAKAREVASLTVSQFVDALRDTFKGIIPASTWTQTWPPEIPLARVREVAEREFREVATLRERLAALEGAIQAILDHSDFCVGHRDCAKPIGNAWSNARALASPPEPHQ